MTIAQSVVGLAWLSLWSVVITTGATIGALAGFELFFRPLRRLLEWRRNANTALDEERRERLRLLEDAHTAWLDAATGCAGELSLMPEDPDWVRRQPRKKPTASDYLRGKLGMWLIFGSGADSPLAALRRATARVRSLSPSESAENAMYEAMEYLAEWGKWREPGWLDRWPQVNRQVAAAFRHDREAVTAIH